MELSINILRATVVVGVFGLMIALNSRMKARTIRHWQPVILALNTIEEDAASRSSPPNRFIWQRIPTPEDWDTIREAYQETVGSKDVMSSGWQVPVKIQTSPVHGRGLFASRGISKGEVVWHATCGYFERESHARAFLEALPATLQRDVASWIYLTVDDDLDRPEVWLDLDETALINHATHQSNLQPDDSDQYVATRDIIAGEELFLDYNTYLLSRHDAQWHRRPEWYHRLRREFGIFDDVSDFLFEEEGESER